MERVWEFNAELVRVIDGDTYVFSMDLGFKVYSEVTVRIMDINAPEIRGVEKEQGFIARDYVVELFSRTEKILVRTEYDRSFARYLGHVFLDGNNLAEILVEQGLAVRV